MAKLLGQVSEDDIRVQARKKDVDNVEEKIRQARAERDAADNATDKKLAADKIAGLEKDLQKSKDRVEQEKNRRVLGSSYDPEGIRTAMTSYDRIIKDYEDDIKSHVAEYATASDSRRKVLEDEVNMLRDYIDEARDMQTAERRAAGVNTGYADSVEGRGWVSSQVTGKNKGINRTVGKKLRKEYSKSIKGDSRSGDTGGTTP